MDIGFKQSVTDGFIQETFIEQSSMVGILEGWLQRHAPCPYRITAQ